MHLETTKIRINIAGSAFDIDLEAEFAKSFLPEIEQVFEMESKNDVKLLLQNYVKKSYELYQLQKNLKNSIDKLDL